MTSISDPAYSEEPAGGRAESIPEPLMDGALDDMSDGGTPKVEAQDLDEAGRGDEVTPPDTEPHEGSQSLADTGLADGPVERGEVKG